MALGLLIAYLVFVGARLGLHQRLPLAFGPISLEHIPDRAAAKHGDAALFTSDTPCCWRIAALQERYSDPTSWSARKIQFAASYLARLFQDSLGVERGDRVAILKRNHFDIHVLILGIVRAGAVACPMNGKFPGSKIRPYISNIGARLLISDSATLLRVLAEGADLGCVNTIVLAETNDQSIPPDFDSSFRTRHPNIQLLWLTELLAGVQSGAEAIARGEDEPLFLVHSSGTTGFPKAVILRNGAQSHAVRGWLCYVHLSRTRDRGYLAVPNNHQAVILTFHSLLLLGLPVHWTSGYERDDFDAQAVIAELARDGFTGFFGFPITYTQLKEMDLESHDLSRMRFWASTADAAHESIQRRFVEVGGAFRSLGLPLAGSIYLDAQGSSEVGTPSVIRYITPLTKRFERRIGKPGSTPFGPRIRIVGPDGRPAARGGVGRLEVYGKTVFNGYWNNHALSCRAIRDGWFFTGDVARRGKDGHLVQLDREVDVIATRDGPVYSLLIEERVHKHPAVFDACVYGARQPNGTQRPAAAIALRPGFAPAADALREELNAGLAPAEALCRVDILPWSEFPIGITGKTLKRVFRERTEPEPPSEQNRPVGWED